MKFRWKSTPLKIEPSIYHLVILYSCFFFLKSISKKPGLHLIISSCVSASLCQAFLAESVATGTRNRCVGSKPRMFCEEILGKIRFRAFPKRVGPQILSLEIVDYFGTSEQTQWWNKKMLISKTAMVGCCKLSL